MRKNLLFLFIIVELCSCIFNKKPSPYKGYATNDGTTYYKYVDLGTKTDRISAGETMEVFMNYARMNDSVFWDSHDSQYPFTQLISYDSLTKSNTYLNLLLKCTEGDSINFIVKKSALYPGNLTPACLEKDTMLKIHLRIVAIMDSNQLKIKVKSYSGSNRYKEMKEAYELKQYLKLNRVPDSDKIGDIYLLPLIDGNGPLAGNNSNVSISYRGSFINNKVFDSIPPDDPIDFNISDSGQVITGLETGVKKMREGEVAKIIIPSHSAFGEKGSSTGIVPPYTTLVYEVTMVSVKKTLKKTTKQ
jgi:FKBP-type peptidyl-prolyl cis-trans isomerase FkpA